MSSASPASRSQRERQRADTRERIYQAALAEFRLAGCARAQIDRIAQAAGVVRGTFYFHFPRREHVLLELQTRVEQRSAERLATLREPRPSLRQILAGVVDVILESEASLGEPVLWRDMILMYVRPPDDPAMRAQDFPLIRELQHLIAGAAERGELHDGIDPDRFGVMFMTSVFGFLVTGDDPLADRRADLESLVDVFIGGVKP